MNEQRRKQLDELKKNQKAEFTQSVAGITDIKFLIPQTIILDMQKQLQNEKLKLLELASKKI